MQLLARETEAMVAAIDDEYCGGGGHERAGAWREKRIAAALNQEQGNAGSFERSQTQRSIDSDQGIGKAYDAANLAR